MNATGEGRTQVFLFQVNNKLGVFDVLRVKEMATNKLRNKNPWFAENRSAIKFSTIRP